MAQAPVFDMRQQQGWETTSHDYNLHISRIERMPSVLPDVPRYPNLHGVFNNRVVKDEEPEVPKKQKHSGKKVQISGRDQVIGQDSNDGEEFNVDKETDGFIQQKRKGFQLCKWKTFKLL